MDSIGDTLRNERLRRGLDLDQVTAQTTQHDNKLSRLARIPAVVWLAATIFGGGVISNLWENPKQDLHQTSATAKSRSTEVQAVARASAGEFGSAPGFAAMRVAFTANEPVWVSIKSDGIHTYSGTLERQQSKEFNASSKMTILVGNAGGLAISMNGKPVALVGTHGEVQLLELTPNGAKVIPQQRTGASSSFTSRP